MRNDMIGMKESNNSPDGVQLDRIVLVGRTLSEYLKFFDLDLSLWKECKILDCPAGTASFVAEAKKRGIHAVGCDPLFGSDLKVLVEHAKADVEHIIEKTSLVPHLYDWNFHRTMNSLKKHTTLALRQFAEDYPIGIAENRYIKAELPRLPFDDKSFDLVLCGHFLFIFSSRFDYSFHINSILELVRVSSKEVRIYPIQGMDAKPYEYIENILSELRSKGITCEIVPVSFEFLRNGNQMLRLIR